MKNRVLVFLADFCTYLGGIGIIAGFFWDFAGDRYYFFSTLLSSGLMGNLFCAHCPACNKLGLHPNPFTKNAGRCKHCGTVIEYERNT